jgi:twitching motility protein PilT
MLGRKSKLVRAQTRQAPASNPAMAQRPKPSVQPGQDAANQGTEAAVRSRLLPQGEKARKLSSYSFIDMYISNDPLVPVMANGLRSADVKVGSFGKGLMKIPDELEDDVLRLYNSIDRMWKHTDYKREFRVTLDGRSYRCALIAAPRTSFSSGEPEAISMNGDMRWVVRQIRDSVPKFNDLRIPVETQKIIHELAARRGLVLCSGPFASGKTTLASSILDYWVEKTRSVGITLEDPPEIPLGRVTEDRGVIYQIDLMDRSIREAIKNARRWSPRYVFLGEVRTSDVAGELLHMSISGPLTICTIHASDPVQAITSLFRFAATTMSEEMAQDIIAASLLHIFHQEMKGGRMFVRHAQVHGDDNHLIRSKIQAGNFRSLYEDFERQAITRQKAKAGV